MGSGLDGVGSGGRLGLLAGGELEEQRGLLDAEGAEDLLLVGGELGPLAAVPAWPANVPRCRRWSSSRRLRQVSPVWFSAIRISSSASQQSSTCARIRSSLRWWTGRRSSVVFMSRQARSISNSCL